MIAATVGAAAGAGPTVILHGHADVVPGRPEQFVPRVDGDRLYGRGAYDMKGGLAAMMVATRDLVEQKAVRVHFVCVCDEESDEVAQRGSDYLVEQGYTGDFAITGEPTDLHIGVQAKGVLALRIEVHRESRTRIHPVAGRQRRGQGGRRLPRTSSRFRSRASRRSSSIARRSASDGSSAATRSTRCRTCARSTWTSATCRARTRSRSWRTSSAIPDVTVVKVLRRAPAIVERTNPYVQLLAEAIAEGTPTERISVGRDGTSDAISFIEAGTPAVEFGPEGAGHHGPEEWVSISSLPRYSRAHRGVRTPDSRPPDHGTPSHCLTRSHADTDSGSASCWERS